MKNNQSIEDNAKLDVIGDVHGDAERLARLLEALGYQFTRGAMRHAEGRRAVFVGDLVDRGPNVPATLAMVRAMVDAGSALMVLGNHEFNLLCFLTPDGNGGFLRAHTERNIKTCRATLDQFRGRENELRGFLEWFRTLPLYLDLGGCRVVHAEWNSEVVAGVNGRIYLDDEFLHVASSKGSETHSTIETLLKGTEVSLPAGHTFTDLDGAQREKVRIRWPISAAGQSYRQVAFGALNNIPDIRVPNPVAERITGYGPAEPPVFFGHYALRDLRNAIVAPNAACLDHGCGKGGTLVAYRWNGERTLSADNFVSI